jgi:ABC-type glycerol-3-phosphate transport system substrate-binding protein
MTPHPPRPHPAQRGLTRRRLLRLAGGAGAATALGGALSGCASHADAQPLTSGDVDISFWTHDAAYVEFFQKAADNAERRGGYPFRWQLKETIAGATDVVTKSIAQAIAGRGTPDVAGLEINQFPRVLRGEIAPELLEPLDDAVADVRDDLLEVRTAPFTKDGTLYALDSDAPLVVLYYREPEWRRVGLPIDVGSWDELADAATRVRERHDIAIGALPVGGTDPAQILQPFDMLLLQRGGSMFDREGNLTVETPEAEEVLSFMVRGARDGFLTTVSDFYGAGMQTALKTGKVIGQWMATWYRQWGLQANVPEQSGEWRIRPLPVFPSGGSRTAFTGGTGFAAFRGKENTLASVDLIKAAYLTPAEQVRRYRVLGYLPNLRSVFDDPELLRIEDEYCGGQRTFEVYQELIDEAPPVYLSEDRPIVATVLGGYLTRALRGDMSPRDALSSAADDIAGQTRD